MVSIVVTLVNDKSYKELLNSMSVYGYGDRYDVIIANDGWIDLNLPSWCREVRTKEPGSGYGPACNLGIEQAHNDIVVCMNDDVYIGDFAGMVISTASNNSELFGAQLLRFNTGWNTFRDEGGRVITIPYLNGWFVYAKKEVWKELDGGFDTRFVPCDFEDVDLSYRASLKGIPLKEVSLPLNHIGGRSANSPGRESITKANRLLFAQKWGLTAI